MLYNLYPIDCIKGSKKDIKGSSVDLIITDPPYGISGDTLQKHYHRNEEHVIDGYVEIPQNEYPKFSLNWIKEAELCSNTKILSGIYCEVCNKKDDL